MTTAYKTADTSRRTARRGDVLRWSRTLIPTTKEAPADAEAVSHVLLVRAGYIRRVGAGIYDYLPLAWRVLQRLSAIIREEMNAAGACEMLMPALEPIELFAGTKRDIDYGDNLFRLTDRHGRAAALAPTHEEIITELMKSAVSSYRQLPLNLYQIQTKFRDEFRPRSGLLRGREFIMKDAYSFHLSLEGPGGLGEGYDAMRAAYINIFTRCGLDFTVVEAESGPIGGSASHEFMVNCEAGEDIILRCPNTGYAANVEKCATGERPWSFAGEPTGELEIVRTPDMPSIEAVSKFLKVKPANMLKTIVFQRIPESGTGVSPVDKTSGTGVPPVQKTSGTGVPPVQKTSGTGVPPVQSRLGEPCHPGAGVPPVRWVLAVVRADHEVNPGKVKDAAGFPVALADEKEAKSAGFSIGYVSPRAALRRDDCLLLVDPDAAWGTTPSPATNGRDARPTDADSRDSRPAGKPMFWATGADEPDHHVKHFNWRREMGAVLDNAAYVKVADIRNALAGDPSPRDPQARLVEGRGVEVGHIFKLGTKYSDAMGFAVLDADQQRKPVIMGCYGIGVSRTLQACVEMSHDQHGIVWPAALAPFDVIITTMDADPQGEVMRTADRVAAQLADLGLDVLIDDRDDRPGVKFKDADLIGVPVRLTIGDKALAQGAVEFKRRDDPGRGDLVPLTELPARFTAHNATT